MTIARPSPAEITKILADHKAWLRGQSSGTRAVLTDADLTGADLTGAVLTRAVLTRAVLTDAVLTDADLTGADLTGAVLTRAVLTDADLTDAVLTGAVLTRADLTRAVLTDAVLTGAVLTRADLTDAVLTDADITRADLTDAVLTDADITDAVLTPIRDDIWAVLSSTPAEAEGLRLALIEGKVDGSTYEGECACLVGTLANVKHCNYTSIPGLKPNSARPAERFFLAIRPGHTPETSQLAKLAVAWIEDWLTRMRVAFGTRTAGAT